VKAHFGFKAADIKELPVFQRNIYAAFASTHRRTKDGTEIPHWYYENDRGKWKLKPGILANVRLLLVCRAWSISMPGGRSAGVCGSSVLIALYLLSR